jgi:hypothetical protein
MFESIIIPLACMTEPKLWVISGGSEGTGTKRFYFFALALNSGDY